MGTLKHKITPVSIIIGVGNATPRKTSIDAALF